MKQTAGIMMALIRSVVCGEEGAALQLNMTAEQLKKLCALSAHHDMAHLVASALEERGLLDEGEIGQQLRRRQMMAVYREVGLEQETARVCETLEAAGIDYIPLKGSVIRNLYPETWMRTSCDVDILIKRETLETAVAVLCDSLGYTRGPWTSHDVGLISESGVHIELHFDTVEDGRVANAASVLADVWACARREQGSAHRYRMPDGMFYLYHVAHMAKHFIRGGCGVKPFLDLWLLRHRTAYDGEERARLLAASGLTAFDEAAVRLSEAWFSGAEADALCREMECFLLRAGMYGDLDNIVAVSQVKKGGKWRHALYKIWLPYRELAVHYPSLEGKKWLLPFYEVRRWCKLIFRGGFRRSINELRTTAATSEEKSRQVADLLAQLEI